MTEYRDFCLKCVNDDDLFGGFKRSPSYNGILEHVVPVVGGSYLEVISKHEKIHNQLDSFKRNDTIGDPRTCKYHMGASVATFSPTTLRYIKVACDLDKFLGDLSGLKVCEIGGGYGGQLLTLDTLHKNLDYSIVDLEGPLLLAKKYLSHHALTANVRYIKPEDVKPERYDLVISNYAFSELNRDIQGFYVENILSSSSHGYITYNHYENNFSLEDYVDHFGASIIDEFPLTHPFNKIIFWGNDNYSWSAYND